VANDTTNRCTGRSTQNPAANNITGNAANYGTGGSTFLLMRHTGTSAQPQCRHQQDGWQASGKTSIELHDKFLQIKLKKRWHGTNFSATSEVQLFSLFAFASVWRRTQRDILSTSMNTSVAR
jgi:hypothetical protein